MQKMCYQQRQIIPSEVIVYWSELPSITSQLLAARGPNYDLLVYICMHLRRGDIKLDTWAELPYKE